MTGYGQDFSNKGKDFWVSYPQHIDSTLSVMGLYITSDVNTSGTITINGSNIPFTVTANSITPHFINQSGTGTNVIGTNTYVHLNRLRDGVKTVAAIHITALQPVVVYAHIIRSARSGATLVLPTNVWGKEYIVPSMGNGGPSTSLGEINIIASKVNTQVEITPTATVFNGNHPVGIPFTVILPNVGDVYQLQFAQSADMSGTRIKSISTGTDCNPIGVFSATTWSAFGCGSAGSGDNLFQQIFPLGAWGKSFLTGPLKKVATAPTDNNVDSIRVFVNDPTTVVTKTENGVTTTLTGLNVTGNYYQYGTSKPTYIQADKPVQLVQYILTQSCGNPATLSDPEMIVLNPIEQTINDITVFSAHQNFVPPGQSSVVTHYINVIMKTNSIGSFSINGVIPTASFTPIPGTLYSYLKEDVTTRAGSNPVFRLKADSGFTAIAYGFGSVESYGYNAGTNIKDLLTFITPINPLSISTDVTACTGTPFYFSVTLPRNPDSLTSLIWDYHGFFGTHGDTINAPLTADTTYFIGSNQVWRYKLGHTHTFTPAGIYPITITVGTVTSEGCGNSLIIDRDLYVYDPPTVGFKGVNNGCVTDSLAFTDTTTYASGTYPYKWWWDFGDGNFSTLKNPKHLYTTAGTYTVRYSAISNVGCLSDTATRIISVTNVPIAKFGMSSPICAGVPVTFSDTSSLVSPGAIVKWYLYFGDGTSAIRTTGADTIHAYTPWNASVKDSLIVETNTGCKSSAFIKTFKVNPIPVPNFTLPAGVCLPWDSAHFINTSTIADGTGGFNYKWDFGDPPSAPNDTSILANPVHYYNNVGPFSIKLTSTSAAGCAHDTTKVLSNIYLQAHALFTVNAENCLNTPTIFTDNSNGIGNTIAEYHWDFGDASPDVNTANPSHTYATPGLKTIKHWVKTNVSCYSDTSTMQVTINPLPTADYTYTLPSCATRSISFTDASVPNAGTLTDWQWNFGDGSPVDNTQSPTHAYTNAGTYNVTLTVTTSKGCVSNPIATKSVVINPRPLAGFVIPEVCLSDTYAQFLDTSKVAAPGFINGWNWTFGDGSPVSTTQSPQHSYTAVGPYNVRLIATSNLGCKDTLTQQLIVNGSFPAANFTVINAGSLCANDSVGIVEASTVFPGNITKVEIYWDNINFPAVLQLDDFPFTGKVYKHLYLPNSQVTKTYQIRYRAYSGGVCVNDKLGTITVNGAPKVQFNVVPDVCYDAAPFQITQASETGGVPGSGVYSGAGVTPTGLFNPLLAGIGTHSIKYTFTSVKGCIDTISQNIKVLDTAHAVFAFAGPNCQGSPATFKETSTAPAGVTLANTTWNFGDGTALEQHAPGSTFTHSFPGWGYFTVTEYNTSAYGCKSTNSVQQVYVNPNPQPVFSFTPSSVCLPNAVVSFVNASSIADNSGLKYQWFFGDIASGPLNASTAVTPPPHNYSTVGPYTVQLTVTGTTSNCATSIFHDVNFIHPQPKAAFDFNKQSVCIGDYVTFNDQTNGMDGTVVQWNWNFGDGLSGNNKQEQHLYGAANTYNVSLFTINSQGCNSDTLTQQFTVYPYPVVDAGPDRLVLQGGSITMQPVVTGNDLQYLWSPATYLDNRNIEVPVASNMLDDITYSLTVTGRGGCTAPPDYMFVKVLKAPNIPNTFTPNGDGINETWLIGYLDTYPDCKVEVFTRAGQSVFLSKGYKTPWDGTLKGKPLPFDTYYYIIEPGNGRAPITGYVTLVK